MAALFDVGAAWAGLTDAQRQEWGRVAIVVALGNLGAFRSEAHDAAADAGLRVLVDLAIDQLGLGVQVNDPPLPDLAAIGVRSCSVCGCTDNHACPEGCSWVADRLCSACALPAPVAP